MWNPMIRWRKTNEYSIPSTIQRGRASPWHTHWQPRYRTTAEDLPTNGLCGNIFVTDVITTPVRGDMDGPQEVLRYDTQRNKKM